MKNCKENNFRLNGNFNRKLIKILFTTTTTITTSAQHYNYNFTNQKRSNKKHGKTNLLAKEKAAEERKKTERKTP